MSVQLKASKSFLNVNIATKIVDGNTVTAALTLNEKLFPNLPYNAAELAKINTQLTNDNVTAQTGDKTAIAVLRKTEREWKLIFGKTADAVSMVANGSKEMILQAGMVPTSGARQKKQKPERPANLVVKPGKGKGTCAISVDGQKGVSGYLALAADDSVTTTLIGDVLEIDANGVKVFLKANSRRAMQLDGLPSVKQYCVSVFTFNSAGTSPLSNSEEMVTQ